MWQKQILVQHLTAICLPFLHTKLYIYPWFFLSTQEYSYCFSMIITWIILVHAHNIFKSTWYLIVYILFVIYNHSCVFTHWVSDTLKSCKTFTWKEHLLYIELLQYSFYVLFNLNFYVFRSIFIDLDTKYVLVHILSLKFNSQWNLFNQLYNYIIYNQRYVIYIKYYKHVSALPLNFLQMQVSSSFLMKSKLFDYFIRWRFQLRDTHFIQWSLYTFLVFYGLAKLSAVSCIHL